MVAFRCCSSGRITAHYTAQFLGKMSLLPKTVTVDCGTQGIIGEKMSSTEVGTLLAAVGLPTNWPPKKVCILFEVALDDGLLGVAVMPDTSLLFQIVTEDADKYQILDQVKTCKLDPMETKNFVLTVQWNTGGFSSIRINRQMIFESEPLEVRQKDLLLEGRGTASSDLCERFPLGIEDEKSRCARETAIHERAVKPQMINILRGHLRDSRDRLGRAVEAASEGDRSAFRDIAARLRDMACGSPKPFGLLAKCAGVLKVELPVYIANNQDPFPLDLGREESGFVVLLPPAFAEPLNSYGRAVDYERWREFDFVESSSASMTVRDFIKAFADQLGSHVDLDLKEDVSVFVKVDGGGRFQLGLAMPVIMMLGKLHLALSEQLLVEFEKRSSRYSPQE